MVSFNSIEGVHHPCSHYSQSRHIMTACFDCLSEFRASPIWPAASHEVHRADLPESAIATRSAQHLKLVGAAELIEVDRFGAETFRTETDRKESLVLGIAECDVDDMIYIADTYNSKLKRLNFKTRQVDEVRY